MSEAESLLAHLPFWGTEQLHLSRTMILVKSSWYHILVILRVMVTLGYSVSFGVFSRRR